MPSRHRRRGRKTKFVTKRGLPFQLMKYAEAKFKDQAINVNILAPAIFSTNVVTISDVAQGNEQNARDGDHINISGVYARYRINTNDAASPQFVRIVMYTPRVVDTEDLPTTNVVGLIDPAKFKVWYDKTSVPSFQQGSGVGILHIRKKWKPYMKAIYTTSAGDSITQGRLLVLFLSTNSSGVTLSADIRMYFKDL